MSIHATPVRTVWCAVLTGLLVACSTSGPGATGRSLATRQAQAPQVMAQQEPQAEKPQISDRMKAIIDKLNLTPDQIAKIQAMIQQRPKPDEAEVQARVEQIKGLLSAPVVDVAALTAHIEHDRQQIHKRIANMIDVVTGIQAILTPEQRAILAKIPPAEDAPQPDITADLDLTAQQKAAIESLRPVAADTSLRKAIHEFMVSGDKDALAKAINDSADRLPKSEEIAQSLATLTQKQRQELIDLVAERIQARKAQAVPAEPAPQAEEAPAAPAEPAAQAEEAPAAPAEPAAQAEEAPAAPAEPAAQAEQAPPAP